MSRGRGRGPNRGRGAAGYFAQSKPLQHTSPRLRNGPRGRCRICTSPRRSAIRFDSPVARDAGPVEAGLDGVGLARVRGATHAISPWNPQTQIALH